MAACGPILVVDDEFSIVETLAEILSWEGYKVAVAQNGKRALDVVAREKPSLILLDFMMPVMDGLQFLKKLRSDPAFRDVPVTLMTAAALPPAPPQDARWDAVLRKPFELPVLLNLVRRLAGAP